MNMIQEKIAKIIGEQLGVAPHRINTAARFEEDFGVDSLDAVEITMALEDEFGIEITDEQMDSIKTVQQAIDFVTTLVEQRKAALQPSK